MDRGWGRCAQALRHGRRGPRRVDENRFAMEKRLTEKTVAQVLEPPTIPARLNHREPHQCILKTAPKRS